MKKIILDGRSPAPVIPEKEAAELLGISNNTLKKIRYAREIEFFRIGGQVFYSQEMLENFLFKCYREAA
jgi:excisionase family DNA binding protein